MLDRILFAIKVWQLRCQRALVRGYEGDDTGVKIFARLPTVLRRKTRGNRKADLVERDESAHYRENFSGG